MKIQFTFLRMTVLSTALLISQAYAAAVFTPASQPLGYIGPIELSTTDLTNGATAYRGWFENGGWQGDLIEYSVTNTGAMSTSIDLTGAIPATGSTTTNWSAHVQFAANQTASYWDTGRKILLGNGTNQVAFRWSSMTVAQKQAVDLFAYNNSAASSDIVDFLRGERANEYPSGPLRPRYSVLGDIIHSNPEYVGRPEASHPESSYTTFVNNNASRAPRVYVGANDGMLHAFDAVTGNEVWAYIPSMVVDNLSRLAGRPYTHAYFVDGSLTAQDAYFNSSWHTVLAGSLGGGGKGLFALDVTSPALSSETASTGADRKVLWELDAAGDNDLGFIFDASTIAQLNDGKWYAINGNGVSSTNGIAKLYLVNIETGAVTKISTSSGSSTAPNGLAATALVDTDGDGKADLAFAGDIDGDMWKFDLTGATPGSWNLAYKLYDGADTQPITSAPDVAIHPQSGLLVFFGTGRLYTADDIIDTNIQALFGIQDTGSAPGTGNRLARVLSADTAYTGGGFTETVRTYATAAAIDWGTYNGWKVELPAGERLVTPLALRAGRVKSMITNPDGLSNWLLEVTYDEGATADNSIYDLDRSGVLDEVDRVDNNTDGDLDDPEDIPMAWQRETGAMSQVTIARLAQGFDTLFLNFLNPPLVQPLCTGECILGIEGGHFDVDTDSPTLGDGLDGKTDGHLHEYDDKLNLTYLDYFDINVNGGGAGKLYNVTEVGINGGDKFIVVLSNADFSPGAEITIKDKTYNVVEYQAMIHKQLAAWDGTGSLKDPDGNSLVYSLSSIRGSGGTLRNTFDSRAIISGGLHPTKTGCVNGADSETNGRWRNGALTMQLIDLEIFWSGGPALDDLDVQTPDDLLPYVVLTDGTTVMLQEDLNNDGDIDTGAPDYEAYGGLIAKDNDDFFYESTVFWHYSGVCYGDPDWEKDVAFATGQISQELFDKILGEAGFADLDALIARIAVLEALNCKDIKEKDGGCKDEYKELAELFELSKLITDGSNPPPGQRTITGVDGIGGVPVIVSGGGGSGGLTSGPNFNTGRRTWIDILPE